MKRALYLLKRYQDLGVTFQLSGPDIKIKIPKGVKLSENEIAEIQTKKLEIIKILSFCPARCRRTKKCYGSAYYDVKPLKTLAICDITTCRWEDKRYKLMTEGYAVEGGEVIIYAESSCVG